MRVLWPFVIKVRLNFIVWQTMMVRVLNLSGKGLNVEVILITILFISFLYLRIIFISVY